MKKIALFSFMVVAVLGMMTSRAQGDEWSVNVNIVNSAESPVMLSLANNDDAGATFSGGGSTCILQPGQSTLLSSRSVSESATTSIQWNILYGFYDGTDSINQKIDSRGALSGPSVNCATPSQSGLLSVSAGTYVDSTFTNYDTGDTMASWMGLSGTSEKVIGSLIDWWLTLSGLTPVQSTTEQFNYSITIGQKDYNIGLLAGVNWVGAYYYNSPPPSVTFVQGQQIYGCIGYSSWLSSQNLNNKSTIAAFTGAIASAGTTAGQIARFDMSSAAPQSPNYTTFSSTNSVVQISSNPTGSQYVAALNNSSVWYSDGANVTQLAGIGTGSSPITQMCVNWQEGIIGPPPIVVGCADGQVEYYNGSWWVPLQQQFQNTNWYSSVMQLSAYWDTNNLQLQVVVGLGNGAIEYWNGSEWIELQDTGWSNPVYQLRAQFSSTQQPNVLVTLMDGAIFSYTPATNWTKIRNNDNNYCIIDMAPQGDTVFPTFMAGFRDGSVSCFIGGKEYPVTPVNSQNDNRVQFISAGFWNISSDTAEVAFVYSQNYQFTYVFAYPTEEGIFSADPYFAIPSVSSACGDIDGDGKGDIISVEGSNWYAWLSSNQYSTRYAYDLGVFGKPVIGDLDGDGKGDLIMVKGSHWYAWTSSSGYKNRIDWDLGIYGSPLTGDIDGDGKDDLIMVMGSIWYAWTSSSGYTERLGPHDLGGIKGLPAAGDIDGDGKADLVIAIGPNWYTWSSASKYEVRSGPYNMGISGIPKLADIDGDGLADPIVIVGSEWYVWFSSAGYQRFGPYTMNLP